jgi:hypothetical protein
LKCRGEERGRKEPKERKRRGEGAIMWETVKMLHPGVDV